jgi:hypothetical protein
MELTIIEQKQFTHIKKQVSKLATRGTIDIYDVFYNEDIEERLMDIDTLIQLLKQEKSMLNDLLAAK